MKVSKMNVQPLGTTVKMTGLKYYASEHMTSLCRMEVRKHICGGTPIIPVLKFPDSLFSNYRLAISPYLLSAKSPLSTAFLFRKSINKTNIWTPPSVLHDVSFSVPVDRWTMYFQVFATSTAVMSAVRAAFLLNELTSSFEVQVEKRKI
jgi:hypothetical protein